MQQGIRFLRDLSPSTGCFDWRVWNTASTKPSERFLSVKRKRGSGRMLSAFDACMLMNMTCGLCSLTSHSPPSTEGGSSDPQCSSLSQVSLLYPHHSLNTVGSCHTIFYPILWDRHRASFSTTCICHANQHLRESANAPCDSTEWLWSFTHEQVDHEEL